jgi:hypothetical protein
MNMEIPFTDNEIINDVIIVDMNINNWLIGSHISTIHRNRLHTFYMKYGQSLISGINADGDGFFYNYKYNFMDYNTIIFEWEWGGVINNDEDGYIKYRIIFKRE